LREVIIGRYQGPGMTVDHVIAERLESWNPTSFQDLMIWHGACAVAVIKANDKTGEPIVHKLEGSPAPRAEVPAPARTEREEADLDALFPVSGKKVHTFGLGDRRPLFSEDIARPLFRSTQTIATPWGDSVTLECIVFADSPHDGDESVRYMHFPE